MPVIDSVALAVWGGGTLLATSDVGTLAFVPGTAVQHHLMRVTDRSGRQVGLLGVPRNVRGAVFSRDGKTIAVTVREPSQNNLWLFNVASGEGQRITFGPPEEEMPVWSPDGKEIGYTSTRRIVIKSITGATGAHVQRKWSRHVHLSSWSPDGKWLAMYDYDPTSNENIWVLSVDGRDSIPVATSSARELNPVFSPDGHWLAYQSDESGRFEVYVVSFPKLDVKRQVSTGGGYIPRWDASGTSLYFRHRDSLLVAPVQTGDRFELRGAPIPLFATSAFDYDVSPDGTRFLLEIRNPNAPALPIHVVVNWFTELRTMGRRAVRR